MKSVNSEKIMVVEDEWIVADQLCRDLKDLGYTVCSVASTGYEALRKVEEDSPDLILMDIVLKGRMDGIETASRINSQFNIPMLYLTAYTNQEYIERAKETTPFGYLVKPYNQKELHANIEMAIHKHRADKEIANVEMAIYKHRADKETKDYLDRKTVCYLETIKAFSGASELRGPYAEGHHQRIAEFMYAIAKEIGLPDFSVEGLWLAAQVYDISLVNMPVEIIQGAGRLTGINLAMYREYPQLSYDILKEVDFPWPVANIALQHRECWDGSGFPREIKGENILIEARILGVADALEDLTSHRSFRNAFPLKQALEEINVRSGSLYDPNVVDACMRLFNDEGL